MKRGCSKFKYYYPKVEYSRSEFFKYTVETVEKAFS